MTEYSFNKKGAPLSHITIRGCRQSHTVKLEDHPDAETLKYVSLPYKGVFLFKVVNNEDILLYHTYGECGNNMHDTVRMEEFFDWADGDWCVHCV